MFFIAAGVYAVGGIVFCVLTSGSVQPWAFDNRMSAKKLQDVTKSTTEVEVVVDQSESVDCRPKSLSNRELPTVGQESLYMQMLAPYFELEMMAGKKYADHGPVCRPNSPKRQSNGELTPVAQENLYMQMLYPYFELEMMAGKKNADHSPVCRPNSQSNSNRELPTVGQESLYMQMLSTAYFNSPVYDINRSLYCRQHQRHGTGHIKRTTEL